MRKTFISIPTILSLFFLASCGSQEKTTKCDVLVSIPPYIYFVNELTNGELVTVSLVPEGANPHLYEPSPRQVAEAREAKAWIRLSEGFEIKIANALLQQNPNLVLLNLAKELSLPHLHEEDHVHTEGTCSHCHHDNIDLHFWMSLELAQQQADLIAKALIQAFPERLEQIKHNLPIFQKKITETHSLIKEKLAPYEGEAILVSHPACGYFCHDYNLEQISIEMEGKDPLPQQISSILESVHSIKIRTILTQAQYNNKGALMIGDILHLKTHEVDPYSANYLNNLVQIATFIERP